MNLSARFCRRSKENFAFLLEWIFHDSGSKAFLEGLPIVKDQQFGVKMLATPSGIESTSFEYMTLEYLWSIKKSQSTKDFHLLCLKTKCCFLIVHSV